MRKGQVDWWAHGVDTQVLCSAAGQASGRANFGAAGQASGRANFGAAGQASKLRPDRCESSEHGTWGVYTEYRPPSKQGSSHSSSKTVVAVVAVVAADDTRTAVVSADICRSNSRVSWTPHSGSPHAVAMVPNVPTTSLRLAGSRLSIFGPSPLLPPVTRQAAAASAVAGAHTVHRDWVKTWVGPEQRQEVKLVLNGSGFARPSDCTNCRYCCLSICCWIVRSKGLILGVGFHVSGVWGWL
jgi:hypothetical protein